MLEMLTRKQYELLRFINERLKEAGGTPIAAVQPRRHTISVPPDTLGSEHINAMEDRGNPMGDAGILEGHMALCRPPEPADTGAIVVALIDEEEATLKRFRRRGASI